MGNNIRALRRKNGWSLETLGKKVGVSFSLIQKLEKGERQIDKWANRLAAALECAPEDIFAEPTSGYSIPIVGYIGAGAEVYPIDDYAKGDGMYEVERPAWIPETQEGSHLALEVRGESMYPLISDGYLIFYGARVFGVPSEFINKMCVVKIADGATMVKRIERGNKIGCYHLISINPNTKTTENARIEWSALVEGIKPK